MNENDIENAEVDRLRSRLAKALGVSESEVFCFRGEMDERGWQQLEQHCAKYLVVIFVAQDHLLEKGEVLTLSSENWAKQAAEKFPLAWSGLTFSDPSRYERHDRLFVFSKNVELKTLLASGAENLHLDIGSTKDGKKSRVCLVTNEIFGPTRNGGIGTAYTSLAHALADAGEEVTILFSGDVTDEQGAEHWVEYYQKAGIEFVPIIGKIIHEHPDLDWEYDNIRRSHIAYHWLKNQEQQFDVIHFAECNGHGYYTIMAKQAGLAFANSQLCIGVHSSTEWIFQSNEVSMESYFNLSTDWMERYCVEHCDVMVGPSLYLIEWMRNHDWNLPARVWQQQYVQPQRAVGAISGGAASDNSNQLKELIFFGRLETRKGLVVFCDALDHLAKEEAAQGLKVTFMGKEAMVEGEHAAKYLEARSQNWKVDWQILNTLQQDEALGYLQGEGRMALMPSTVDNSPNTVYECIGLGVPFIASRTGGIPELIHPDDVYRSTFYHREESKRGVPLAEAILRSLQEGLQPVRPAVSPELNEEAWVDWHRSMAALPRVEQKEEASLSSPTDYSKEKEVLVSIVMPENCSEKFFAYLTGQSFSAREILSPDDLDKAKGDYLFFPSLGFSPDIDMLEKLYKAAQSSAAELVTGFAVSPKTEDEQRDEVAALGLFPKYPIGVQPLLELLRPSSGATALLISRRAFELAVESEGYPQELYEAELSSDQALEKMALAAAIAGAKSIVLPEPSYRSSLLDSSVAVEPGSPLDYRHSQRVFESYRGVLPPALYRLGEFSRVQGYRAAEMVKHIKWLKKELAAHQEMIAEREEHRVSEKAGLKEEISELKQRVKGMVDPNANIGKRSLVSRLRNSVHKRLDRRIEKQEAATKAASELQIFSLLNDPKIQGVTETRKTHSCVVSTEIFGPSRCGGVGTAFTSIAMALAEAGHEVTVLFVRHELDSEEEPEHWIKYYAEKGIRLVFPEVVDMENQEWDLNILRRSILTYELLKGLSEEKPIDIIHVAECNGLGYYALMARRLGIAFQNTEFCLNTHGSSRWQTGGDHRWMERKFYHIEDHIEPWCIANTDSLLSPSRYLIHWSAEQGWELPQSPKRLLQQPYVQPHAARVVSDATTLRDKIDHFNEIVLFGRLETRKGVVALCDALDILSRDRTALSLNIKVTFLGKDTVLEGTTSKEYLAERGKKWKWDWQIIDDYNQEQAIGYLQGAGRLTMMPSLDDNFPNTVMECLGLGVPFITSCAGGIPEMIHPDDLPSTCFAYDYWKEHGSIRIEDWGEELATRLLTIFSEGLRPARPAVDYVLNEESHVEWHERMGIALDRDLSAREAAAQAAGADKILVRDSSYDNLAELFEQSTAEHTHLLWLEDGASLSEGALAEFAMAAASGTDFIGALSTAHTEEGEKLPNYEVHFPTSLSTHFREVLPQALLIQKDCLVNLSSSLEAVNGKGRSTALSQLLMKAVSEQRCSHLVIPHYLVETNFDELVTDWEDFSEAKARATVHKEYLPVHYRFMPHFMQAQDRVINRLQNQIYDLEWKVSDGAQDIENQVRDKWQARVDIKQEQIDEKQTEIDGVYKRLEDQQEELDKAFGWLKEKENYQKWMESEMEQMKKQLNEQQAPRESEGHV